MLSAVTTLLFGLSHTQNADIDSIPVDRRKVLPGFQYPNDRQGLGEGCA